VQNIASDIDTDTDDDGDDDEEPVISEECLETLVDTFGLDHIQVHILIILFVCCAVASYIALLVFYSLPRIRNQLL
jgi:hypothetical protein